MLPYHTTAIPYDCDFILISADINDSDWFVALHYVFLCHILFYMFHIFKPSSPFATQTMNLAGVVVVFLSRENLWEGLSVAGMNIYCINIPLLVSEDP